MGSSVQRGPEKQPLAQGYTAGKKRVKDVNPRDLA